MNQSIVISVIGLDRRGLVDVLSGVISEHGGNWEGSRLAHLGGQFSGMVHVLIAEEGVDGLEKALCSLEGLTVQFARGEEVVAPRCFVGLDVVADDRPGIVQQVSRALAGQGANVEELVTDVRSAPMTGAAMFYAQIKVGLPEGMDVELLSEALESLSDDVMVTIRG